MKSKLREHIVKPSNVHLIPLKMKQTQLMPKVNETLCFLKHVMTTVESIPVIGEKHKHTEG